MKNIIYLSLLAIAFTSCAKSIEATVEAKDGINGAGCTVTTAVGGALITCGNTTTLVSDGTSGAPAGSELVYAYDPCGDSPSVFNDEIMFISSSGIAYAYFEDNAATTPYLQQNRRISYLQPGNYRTTDSKDRYCSFTINPPSTYPNIIANEVQN